MKKLMYILLFLSFVVNLTAQENNVIDSVCAGAERHYRIDGEKGYTYIWNIKDSLGNLISNPDNIDYPELNSSGDTVWGGEINVIWNDVGVYQIETWIYTEFGCDTFELGRVNIYDPPHADAGDDMYVCWGEPAVLSTDTAWNYGVLIWTSTGDGTFDDDTQLHPSYTPGINDSINGNVTLILTAIGRAMNFTCDPAVDSMNIQISNPEISDMDFSDVLCFNDSTGWVHPIISGGIEPYTFSWTGPGNYTASTYAIFNLPIGMYKVEITDAAGCVVSDSVEIKQPPELLATADADTTEICEDGFINLTATYEGGRDGFYTHKWTGTGAAYINSTDILTPQFSGALAGNYTLIYTVKDINDCVASDTIEIIVHPPIKLVFDEIDTLCEFSTPPPLSKVDKKGITGTWSPDTISTDAAGTFPFVFTPDSTFRCFEPDTLIVVVLPTVIPLLEEIDPLCQFSIPPSLSKVDKKGITGTWSPDTIQTDVVGIIDYIFTPDLSYVCFEPDTISVEVIPSVIPELDQIDTLCQFSAPPPLPPADTNGIVGTWFPETIQTDVVGPSDYIFTPDSSYICFVPDTITIFVKEYIIPELAYIDTICEYSTPPSLPLIDQKGIRGTWSPDTILTYIAGTYSFVFTPDPIYRCYEPDTLEVVIKENVYPDLAQIDTLCQFSVAQPLPPTDLQGMLGTWSPKVIQTDSIGTFYYVFTPDPVYRCFRVDSVEVVVIPSVVPEHDIVDTLCIFSLAPPLPPTDSNGVRGTWLPDTIDTSIPGIQTFIFTPDPSYLCFVSDTQSVFIMEDIIPDLLEYDTLCQYSIPPQLNPIDEKGIYGTWSPDTIDTNISGNYTFVFTPDPSYRCFKSDSITIVIKPNIIPDLASGDTLCQFSVPPLLPTKDLKGIKGTWSPEFISTSDVGSRYYVFTPDSVYRCFYTDSIEVVVIPTVVPNLKAIETLCQFSTPPVLELNDEDGTTGTWSPETISTDSVGTFNFIFTPDSSYICFVPDSISVTILPTVIPELRNIDPLCQYSVPPILPDTSRNGIRGSWTPGFINTDIADTITFVFTPDSSYVCFETDSITVVILPSTIPDLADIDTLCQYDIPPTLPTTDLLGTSGTWSPNTIQTDFAGTFKFIFTPDIDNGCIAQDSIYVVVLPQIIAAVSPMGPFCQYEIPPPLLSEDLRGIKGTWSPDTINTNSIGTFEYVFTPDLSYKCFTVARILIDITTPKIPELNPIGPFCQYDIPDDLPIQDENGITGTWSPAIISTDVAGTFEYVFTPNPSYGCFVNDTISIEILPTIFADVAPMGPYCQNQVAQALPSFDRNDVSGTWFPELISTDSAGIFPYIFTPDSSYECFVPDTILIEVRGIRGTKDTIICGTVSSFVWNGITIVTDRDSTYEVVLQNSLGCDSVVTFNVYVLPEIREEQDTILCFGAPSFVWNTHTVLTEADSIYTTVLSNVLDGCDTTLILRVTIIPEYRDTIAHTICEAQLPYNWDGQQIDSAGIYVNNLVTESGCDSVLILNLEVLPEILIELDTTFCEGPGFYVWNEQNIATYRSDVYSDTLQNIAGCDSIVIYNVDVTPATRHTENVRIDASEIPYRFNGRDYSSAGSYTIYLTNANNCDSILTLNLDITYEPGTDYHSMCIQDVPYIWNGREFSTEGIHEHTLTSVSGADSIVKLHLVLEPEIIPVFEPLRPYCQYETPDDLPLVSENGITGSWSQKKLDTEYYGDKRIIFTPDPGQCAAIITMRYEVYEEVTPSFEPIGPFCLFSTPPELPDVSNEGYTGIWSPSKIGTTSLNPITYTFTPDPVSEKCIKPFSTVIEILPETKPVLDPMGPYCQNTIADTLPLISANGIKGTWEPSIISTVDAGTSIYVFTPDSTECSVPDSIVIEILPEEVPQFKTFGPYCLNDVAELLPLISDNGIPGSWSPAIINTTVVGLTDYTFTPDSGYCAVETIITIEVVDQIKPVFIALGPFCQNSVAPALPVISENNITGTWSPDTIDTSVAGLQSFVFTPDSGQCAALDTMVIEILPELTPVFDPLGPYCQYTIPDTLPLISNNGVSGTWNADSIDTSVDGTFTYIFTPDSGWCAVPDTMAIVILPEITPVFVQIGLLCQNTTAPPLEPVSVNGVAGTWFPAVIDTKEAGFFTFTFTPTGVNCEVPTIMIVEITPELTPEFDPIGPLCENSIAPELPAESLNGITGTWNPTVIDTKIQGTTTYTFTPAPVYCAVPVTMDIEITEIQTPVFAAFDPLCPDAPAPALPPVSENGISGTWSPDTIDTSNLGTFEFTFTPDSGLCALPVTLDIEISDILPPTAVCRDITVYLDADGKASITTAQIDNGSDDNCRLDTLYLSRYEFGCDDVGENPVTLFAIDGVNLTDECEAIVTVLDTISPTVICRGPFEIQLDENAEYKLTVAEILVEANDVCDIDTMWVYPHELDCDHIGLTTVTLVVVDVNGNESYCETDVMVYGNRPPTVMDDSASTLENTPVVFAVIDNDYDEKTNIDISTLNVSIHPQNGTVSINPDNGDFTYMPNYNFSGVDVLQYQICDDGIPCEPECGAAFVFITVVPVNEKPIARNDYYSAGCFSVSRNVMENDDDPDSDNLTINTIPIYPTSHGELIIYSDGTIDYFPDEGFVGIDSFEYVIWDSGIPSLSDTATVYIEVDCSEESQNPLECEIFIPEGFSPNEDGVHDFFRIMCIHNYPDAKLMIFNRNGDLLWEKEHYGNYDVWGDQYNAWWWGTSVMSRYDVGNHTILGDPLVKYGNYVYVLLLGNGEERNGTVMVAY